MTRFGLAALALLASSGCMTTAGTQGAGTPVAIEADSIRYETGPCFGTCPVYSVTVTPDGAGTFEGRSHTAVTGTRAFRITPAQYRALEAHLAPLRPASGEVRLSGEACRIYATDMPSAKVTWTRQIGDMQSYYLDYGCDGQRNGAARDLLQAVPGLLPIQDLIGRRG